MLHYSIKLAINAINSAYQLPTTVFNYLQIRWTKIIHQKRFRVPSTMFWCVILLEKPHGMEIFYKRQHSFLWHSAIRHSVKVFLNENQLCLLSPAQTSPHQKPLLISVASKKRQKGVLNRVSSRSGRQVRQGKKRSSSVKSVFCYWQSSTESFLSLFLNAL